MFSFTSRGHTLTPLRHAVLLVGCWLLPYGVAPLAAQSHDGAPPEGAVVIEDFESERPGAPPSRWRYISSSKDVIPLEQAMGRGARFYVVEEGGNTFVRARTQDAAERITLRNEVNFDWDLREHPRLKWRWRAHELPEGASEKEGNDVAAAVYVTFGGDWLGRPKSIKYTYSSTLPVGTVVDQGPLRVLVVDSGQEPGTGTWKSVQRNVIADYRQLFGGEPPDRPPSITLWSDSDTLGGTSEADFDDFVLLPPR